MLNYHAARWFSIDRPNIDEDDNSLLHFIPSEKSKITLFCITCTAFDSVTTQKQYNYINHPWWLNLVLDNILHLSRTYQGYSKTYWLGHYLRLYLTCFKICYELYHTGEKLKRDYEISVSYFLSINPQIPSNDCLVISPFLV